MPPRCRLGIGRIAGSLRTCRRTLATPSMHGKRGVESLSGLEQRTVLVRSDLNIPMKDGVITDETRIAEALPTLRFLSEAGAKVVVCSHLGRPKGKASPALSLMPVAARMSEMLGMPVDTCGHSVGPDVTDRVAALPRGGVLLLENVRFHPTEEKNDLDLAKQLVGSCGATAFVNDAFGTAHRAHASTAGVTGFVSDAVAGLLLQKELCLTDAHGHEPCPHDAHSRKHV